MNFYKSCAVILMIVNQAAIPEFCVPKISAAKFLKILPFLPDGNKALLKILTAFYFPGGGI
jgi:hypothetical protein